MVTKALRELWRATPFRPFTIFLADKRKYQVPHPDFLSISPKGTDVIVWDKDGDMHFLSPLLITEASPNKRGRAPRKS
jgi:hypothetical protein